MEMYGAGDGVAASVVACGRVPVRPSLGEGHPTREDITIACWLTASGPLLKNQCPFVRPAHLAVCQLG